MSTRTRMTGIWCGLVATTAIVLVAVQVGLSGQSREQAQILLAPSFTAAQAATGQATYTENCAACHGANLDDGACAPSLRGPEFRSSWFGGSADQLFTKLETMPPTAPGSLGAGRTAEGLAYLMSQNQLVASDKTAGSCSYWNPLLRALIRTTHPDSDGKYGRVQAINPMNFVCVPELAKWFVMCNYETWLAGGDLSARAVYLRFGPLGGGICFCTTSQRLSVHRRQSDPAKSQLASATPLSCQSSQSVLTRAHSPPSG